MTRKHSSVLTLLFPIDKHNISGLALLAEIKVSLNIFACKFASECLEEDGTKDLINWIYCNLKLVTWKRRRNKISFCDFYWAQWRTKERSVWTWVTVSGKEIRFCEMENFILMTNHSKNSSLRNLNWIENISLLGFLETEKQFRKGSDGN